MTRPPPGDLPDPGIEPGSPAWQVDSFPSEPPGKSAPHKTFKFVYLAAELQSHLCLGKFPRLPWTRRSRRNWVWAIRNSRRSPPLRPRRCGGCFPTSLRLGRTSDSLTKSRTWQKGHCAGSRPPPSGNSASILYTSSHALQLSSEPAVACQPTLGKAACRRVLPVLQNCREYCCFEHLGLGAVACMHACSVTQSCPTLCNSMTVAHL